MQAVVMKCNCTHHMQDKRYGHMNRVFNPTSKEIAGNILYRCTVCVSERTKRG